MGKNLGNKSFLSQLLAHVGPGTGDMKTIFWMKGKERNFPLVGKMCQGQAH